jgi:ubiquinone/menaquinone biosynthesis C-methylase UbiE
MSEEVKSLKNISRVKRSRKEAQITYDNISRWYDLLEGNWEKKLRAIAIGKLGAKKGEIVLDIGFGTGHGIAALAKSVGESGHVYGIDISPRMLEITQSRIKKLHLSKRVTLKNGDALQLPFEVKFFDAIFMSFTLELFDTPEIPKVLSECRRVLRICGRICVISLSKEGGNNWIRNLYELGHDKLPKLLDCRPIFVQRTLEESGFKIIDSALVSLWGLPVEIVVARKMADGRATNGLDMQKEMDRQ